MTLPERQPVRTRHLARTGYLRDDGMPHVETARCRTLA